MHKLIICSAIIYFFSTNILAQEKQVLYFGYEDLNQVFAFGGLTGERFLYYGGEAATNFDDRITLKILGYIPFTFYEAENTSYVISIGGAFGYKFGEELRDGSFNEGKLYEGGANIYLGRFMLGYSYGFDEYLRTIITSLRLE